jgi:hypothetical protein
MFIKVFISTLNGGNRIRIGGMAGSRLPSPLPAAQRGGEEWALSRSRGVMKRRFWSYRSEKECERFLPGDLDHL